MVRDGYFGFKEYFSSLCDSLEDDKDFYKLGADFSSYLEAQVTSCIQHCIEFPTVSSKMKYVFSLEPHFYRLWLIECL